MASISRTLLRSAPVTYTDDELDYLEAQCEENVRQQHLFHALDHVVKVLDIHNIPYGVMGGVSMILLGNQDRTTIDVDVAVEGKVSEILAAFSADNRVYLPRAMTVAASGVARMFVLTGPAYGEAIQPPLPVEVDLILNGNKGAPTTLAGVTRELTVDTGLGPRKYAVLTLEYLFRAKLRSYYERASDKDYRDLVWMSFVHSESVSGFIADQDEDLRQHFADEYAAENELLSESRVEWLYTLLGLRRRPRSSSSSR